MKKVGKYDIQKKIGAGGMGAVYLATDSKLRRQVALKVLPRDKATNPTLVKRFLAEATAAAALKHDNIVTIYEAGEADGLQFIALEFIDGTDVANLVDKRGVIPIKRSLDIIKQVTRALEHVHSQGIVHRDIKPANLLIRRDGIVKLTDLGLARALDEATDTSITRPGTTVGTVDYMAPEQAMSSKRADVRSDIYSLGCTWYHMLTGEPPFPDGGMTNKLAAHAKLAPPDPRQKNPKVPETIVAILNRMMAKSPDQRYQTPAELLEDLSNPGVTPKSLMDAWNEGEEAGESAAMSGSSRSPTVAEDEEPPKRGLPPRRGKPDAAQKEDTDYSKVAMVVGIVLFVALAGGILWVVNNYSKNLDLGGGSFVPPVRPGEAAEDPKKKPVGPVAVNQNPNPGGKRAPGLLDASQFKDKNTSPVQTAANTGEYTPSTSPQVLTGGLPTKAAAEFLPAWVRQESDTSNLPVLTVQAGGSQGGSRYSTLNAALSAVNSPGAVIKLVGRGPFALKPQRIDDRGRVVLRPSESVATDKQPLIVLLPGTERASAVLSLTGTALELRQVHVAAELGAWKDAPPSSLIAVTSGDVHVSEASITALGPGKGEIHAFEIDGSLPAAIARPVAGQLRASFQKVVIRGRNLTALSLGAERSECVLQNCLVSSGAAPAIRLPGPSEPRADSGRLVKIAGSTLCSETQAFAVAGNDERPVRTSLALLDSVVARTGDARETALMSLDRWDAEQSRKALGKELGLEARTSVFSGWHNAVHSAAGFSVPSLADWAKQFSTRCRIEQAAWESRPWPAKVSEDLAQSDLTAFSTASLATSVRASAGGAQPGCPIGAVRLTSLEGLEQARPLASRAPPPPIFESGIGAEKLNVDLNKEDLGKVLSSHPLKNGMEIVARGNGPRTSSPIHIKGVWVRIRFEQATGAPLSLAPRSAAPSTGSRDDAFIAVTDGGLQLVDASLTSSGVESRAQPRWLVQVVNGDLAVVRSRLQSQMTGSTRTKGLIQWLRTSAGVPHRPFPGEKEGYLSLVESFLCGTGDVIQADLRQRTLVGRQSILVSRDTGLSLNLSGTEPDIGGTVDLEHCTLTAADRLINVQAASLTGPATKPLEIFADRCVFAPPLRTGPARPRAALLAVSPAALMQNQLAWWESRNGYAPDLSVFLRDPAAASSPDQKFETDWIARWPADSVLKPLFGTGGVILKNELPEDRAKLDASHFVLNPGSKAATWDDGKPIGATTTVTAKASTSTTKAATGPGF